MESSVDFSKFDFRGNLKSHRSNLEGGESGDFSLLGKRIDSHHYHSPTKPVNA
jgi:hypothetical protein